MSEPENFDVFLCHNSKDKADVRIIAQKLKEQGIKAWLDETDIPGGEPWLQKINKTLYKTSVAFLLFGTNGVGEWQGNHEINILYANYLRNQRRSPKIIPIFLPRANEIHLHDDFSFLLNIFQFIKLKSLDHIEQLYEYFPDREPQAKSKSKDIYVELKSEVGIDYSQLKELLSQGKWKEADGETTQLMLKAAKREKEGWLNVDNINNFPCADLRTIDQLWVKYSNGCFGFSVQKNIYKECGAKLDGDYPGDKIWYNFCEQVGWRQKGIGLRLRGENWISYDYLTFDTSAHRGQLPIHYRFRYYIWTDNCVPRFDIRNTNTLLTVIFNPNKLIVEFALSTTLSAQFKRRRNDLSWIWIKKLFSRSETCNL